ncbi:MAG: SpoVR family protein [Actinobacteria bacterium]|nr:SpoVR family protein [Actinomycetota bacterium]
MTLAVQAGLWRRPDYDVADLGELEDICLREAHALGLAPPPVAFHLVPAEVVYDVASRGLPGRYSHWRFGQSYEQMKNDYDRGRSRIYELVVNTRPAHAYLLDGNSLVAQLLVIAHVLGHAVVFEESRYFEPADKGFLPRVRAAAERIDAYMSEVGRTVVEDFVDDCQALATAMPLAQLGKTYEEELSTDAPRRFDELFPDEAAARRRRADEEREAMRRRFPRNPEADVLGFVMKHARGLEDWQRDVIGIVREEQLYFSPQLQTKIIHEGMATWTHNAILQRLLLDSADFVEYQRLNASVTQPHPFSLNPYNVGWAIFRELERIAERPDDDERERWEWAGGGDAIGQILRVIEGYDDVALVSEFLTPKVCQLAKLYAWEHDARDARRLVISSREAEEVRTSLLAGIVNGGLPTVEIVDADHAGRGELLLAHRAEGVGLDAEYAKGTLAHLARLWGKPVVASSVAGDGSPVWYRAAPDGAPETLTTLDS